MTVAELDAIRNYGWHLWRAKGAKPEVKELGHLLWQQARGLTVNPANMPLREKMNRTLRDTRDAIMAQLAQR